MNSASVDKYALVRLSVRPAEKWRLGETEGRGEGVAGSGGQMHSLASQPQAGLTQQDFHGVSELVVTKCHNNTQCSRFTIKCCLIIIVITVNNAAE